MRDCMASGRRRDRGAERQPHRAKPQRREREWSVSGTREGGDRVQPILKGLVVAVTLGAAHPAQAAVAAVPKAHRCTFRCGGEQGRSSTMLLYSAVLPWCYPVSHRSSATTLEGIPGRVSTGHRE